MNVKSLFFGLAALSLGLTSCNLEPDDDDNYMTWQFPVCNLVIPATGNAFATTVNYSLLYYYTNNTIVASTTDLNLGYTTGNFTTNAMECVNKYLKLGNVTSFENGQTKSGNVTVQNLKGFMSTAFNTLTREENAIFGYAFNGFSPIVMSYTANHDYKIKTFMPDAVYTGTTSITTVGSEAAPYQNTGIKYRVIFYKDLKTADVFFYNAKFAAAMQVTINFALRNLAVEYTNAGYKISGTNVVPEMFVADAESDNKWVPMPSYTFDSFEFINTSTDLTVGSATYRLGLYGSNFVGTFSGAYVYDSDPE